MQLFPQYIEKIILFILVVFAVVSPVRAQEEMPSYTPTSAWLVGPASLGETEGYSGQMPCVVANQFGNGFVLRLSGGGGQLMAMAIDFRQKAFAPHQKYEVEFSVPGVFFQSFAGSAYDETTLLFGLTKFPEFYKALQGAETLVITVAEASVGLNLIGLDDGFRRMNVCYGPRKSEKTAEIQRDIADISLTKSSTQNPLIKPDGALTPLPEEAAGNPAPPAETTPSETANLIAKAREAEEAAARLAADSPNKPAPEGRAMASSWTEPEIVRPNPSDIMVQRSAAPLPDSARNMRWRALKGADLQDVLGLWTNGVGVRLMWLADRNFPVMRSLSFEGNFENAVQSLLEQYNGQGDRPVGRIYREPGSQKLVLVIERDKSAP